VPKLKTHRGAAKRFKATGTGKIKRGRAYSSHILTKKNATRRRRLRSGALVHSGDMKRVKAMLPNL